MTSYRATYGLAQCLLELSLFVVIRVDYLSLLINGPPDNPLQELLEKSPYIDIE